MHLSAAHFVSLPTVHAHCT